MRDSGKDGEKSYLGSIRIYLPIYLSYIIFHLSLIHTYQRTCIHIYVYINIYVFIYTYIYTFMHTHI